MLDEEIDAGVRSLLASPAAVLGPTVLSVLTFEVPARSSTSRDPGRATAH